MQGIPSRLKSHCDDCANRNFEFANANVFDDNGMPQPNTNHNPTAAAVIADAPMVTEDYVPLTASSSMPSGDIQLGCSKKVTVKTTVCKKSKKRKLLVFKDNTVISTSDTYVHKINEKIGRYFFATNTPFLRVEHPEFIKLCQLLRPGELFTIAGRTYDTTSSLRQASQLRYDLFTNMVASGNRIVRTIRLFAGRISTIVYISIFPAFD